MQFAEKEIREWADKIELADLTLAELDYRLLSTLESIYSSNGHLTGLAMKGGTAQTNQFRRRHWDTNGAGHASKRANQT